MRKILLSDYFKSGVIFIVLGTIFHFYGRHDFMPDYNDLEKYEGHYIGIKDNNTPKAAEKTLLIVKNISGEKLFFVTLCLNDINNITEGDMINIRYEKSTIGNARILGSVYQIDTREGVVCNYNEVENRVKQADTSRNEFAIWIVILGLTLVVFGFVYNRKKFQEK